MRFRRSELRAAVSRARAEADAGQEKAPSEGRSGLVYALRST